MFYGVKWKLIAIRWYSAVKFRSEICARPSVIATDVQVWPTLPLNNMVSKKLLFRLFVWQEKISCLDCLFDGITHISKQHIKQDVRYLTWMKLSNTAKKNREKIYFFPFLNFENILPNDTIKAHAAAIQFPELIVNV